jgi:hypothetical protein
VIGVIGVAVIAAALAGPAAAAERQTSRLLFTTAQRGASSGLGLDIDYLDAGAGNGKPHAVQTVITRLAPGARIDTSVPERCTATDPELVLLGAAACPPGSRIGGGTTDVDFGAGAGPVPRIVENDVTFINADGQLILLTETTNVPGGPARTVTRGVVAGRETRFEIAPFPGAPPPEPFLAVDEVHVDIAAVSRNGRHYITTPRTCPRSGAWTNEVSFTYRDGITQTVRNQAPCRNGSRR